MKDIAEYIKKKYSMTYLLLGGVHASLNPEECINDYFDGICIGEGERALMELVTMLENDLVPSKISNMWIKTGNNIEKNSTRPFSQDLDSLPFPDREIWQPWIENPNTFSSVLLGRGCPFLCTYCCNHALRKVSAGNYVRLRPVSNILKEIKEIAVNFNKKKEIYLEVETFSVNMNWALELCSALEAFNKRQPQPFSFGTNLRLTPNVDLVNLLPAMKKSNFKFINIGLESGSERVRTEILRRNYSNKDVICAVELAKQNDIKVIFSILIGIPGETLKEFEETINITRLCQPDHYWLNIFCPYPGTNLYRLAKEQGILSNCIDKQCERFRININSKAFSKKQILKNFVWFEYNVYKGKKPLYSIIYNVLIVKVKSNPVLYYLFSYVYGNTLIKRINTYFKKIIHMKNGGD